MPKTPDTREAFHAKIREKLDGLAQGERERVARRLGSNLGYSSSTVMRWFDERTAPIPVVFPTIYKALDAAKAELSLA